MILIIRHDCYFLTFRTFWYVVNKLIPCELTDTKKILSFTCKKEIKITHKHLISLCRFHRKQKHVREFSHSFFQYKIIDSWRWKGPYNSGPSFSRGRNWGRKRFSDLPKGAQWVNCSLELKPCPISVFCSCNTLSQTVITFQHLFHILPIWPWHQLME